MPSAGPPEGARARRAALAGAPVSREAAAGGQLAGVLAGCLEALAEEIQAVRRELARRGIEGTLPGRGGRLLETAGPGFRYEWLLPRGDLDIRPDDGVRVRTGAGETLGFVTSFARPTGAVRVAVSDWLGPLPGEAELEFDPTWLLAALAARLEAICDAPERFHPETALRLLGRLYPGLGTERPRRPASGELNASQWKALERLLGSDVHFVWGPPGTGKTRLLGHAVAELAEAGKVLVVTTTNGALDEAAARTAAALGDAAVRAGRIIRVGAEFSATGDARLSLGAALERRLAAGAGRVETRLAELEDRLFRGSGRPPAAGDGAGLGGVGRSAGDGEGDPSRRRVPGGPGGYRARLARLAGAARAAGDEEARGEVARLAGEIQRQGALALRKADVILCTLAGLAAREELAPLRFHSLVLDEASTAPLPQVVLSASLASRRAVAVGDFQQLPAVVVSRGPAAERWLGRDVFREAGVVGDAPPGELSLPAESDRLCAMLVEQYRMAPPIRALVSDLFYGGRLSDAKEAAERAGPAHPLVLLETSGLSPSVEREEGSRANAAHAEAVVRLLEAAAGAGVDDVAVIVPYRLQARRLWRLVRGRLGRAAPGNLEVSTVHRYQGREKSVVVFDTVDAPPARSWFLHEGRNRDLPRLLNVALSRTRDMLVVVGTVEGLRKTLPEDALLNRLVARMQREGIVVDARLLGVGAGREAGPGLFRPG